MIIPGRYKDAFNARDVMERCVKSSKNQRKRFDLCESGKFYVIHDKMGGDEDNPPEDRYVLLLKIGDEPSSSGFITSNRAMAFQINSEGELTWGYFHNVKSATHKSTLVSEF